MKRHDRARFAVLGLPATFNGLAMLLVAFNATFRSGMGYRWLLPVAVALVCLAFATACAIKRGRDIGWSPVSTVALFVLCMFFGPVVLLPVALLLFLPTRPPADALGPPAPPLGPVTLLIALVLAAVPWLIALLLKMI